jgi:hypothetical protein
LQVSSLHTGVSGRACIHCDVHLRKVADVKKPILAESVLQHAHKTCHHAAWKQLPCNYTARHSTNHRCKVIASWSLHYIHMRRHSSQAMLDVHVTAPFKIIQAVTPLMREAAKQEQAQQCQAAPRSIINISSTSGTHGNAGQANYAAGKAAIVGLTKVGVVLQEYYRLLSLAGKWCVCAGA